jgi:hypothetical protein
MNGGEVFILLIVLAGIGAGVLRRYWGFKAAQPQTDPHYQERIDLLERRVQTLERIVTDKGYDLKREFERL